jgi:hypothetical protein
VLQQIVKSKKKDLEAALSQLHHTTEQFEAVVHGAIHKEHQRQRRLAALICRVYPFDFCRVEYRLKVTTQKGK